MLEIVSHGCCNPMDDSWSFEDHAGGGDLGIVALKLKDDGSRLSACASSYVGNSVATWNLR